MLIDISDIVFGGRTEMTEAVPIGLTSFESRLGSFPITRSTPADLRITHLLDQRIRISGNAELTVTIPCSRCLAEVPTEFRLVIDGCGCIGSGEGAGGRGVTGLPGRMEAGYGPARLRGDSHGLADEGAVQGGLQRHLPGVRREPQ